MKKLLVVFLFIIVLASTAFAQQKLYVNNLIGNDANDGMSPIVGSSPSGPKHTISNAITAAIEGTSIYIAATGTRYVENPVVNKVITFVGYSSSSAGRPVEITLTGGDMVFNPPGNGTVRFNVEAISGTGYNFPAASRFQFRGTSTKGFYLMSGYVRQGNAMFLIIPPFRDRR